VLQKLDEERERPWMNGKWAYVRRAKRAIGYERMERKWVK
jgi:hypothetical protein